MTKREIEAMEKEMERANSNGRRDIKRLYMCDPRKNTKCKKTGCAYKAGRGFADWCFLTMKEECRADSVEDLVGYSF